jgi:hypothetical protein
MMTHNRRVFLGVAAALTMTITVGAFGESGHRVVGTLAEMPPRPPLDLLPRPDAEYFHVVFTVPPAVAEIAVQNKAVVRRPGAPRSRDPARTHRDGDRTVPVAVGARV